MSLQLLSLADVKQCITMPEAIKAMERAFIQLAKQAVVQPLRTGMPIKQEDGLTLTMPAYLADANILGLKVVSVFPNNIVRHMPSINGVILLLDATTGAPSALMDAGYLTALRTGAVSGLATQYFAREDASHVAIVGAGVQAITQLEAVAAVRDIQHVTVWSRNIANAQAFAKQLAHSYDIQVCAELSSAVKTADIICTATASAEPLIHLQDIQPHAHINAIGAHTPMMREIANDVLEKAVVIVDKLDAAMAESGEIISAVTEGKLHQQAIIELGTWLLNKAPSYQDTLTVFKSVGLAIQDMSVADVAYQNALKKQLGTTFNLTQ